MTVKLSASRMDRADVIIFGGGLVGLALASALDSSGLSAILVDPADPGERKSAAFDGRTSAVSSSSMRMLETIGVTQHLPAEGCPIRKIQVADGLDPGGLGFEPEDDLGVGALGVDEIDRVLMAALDRARHPFERVAPLMVVAAELEEPAQPLVHVEEDAQVVEPLELVARRRARQSLGYPALEAVLRHLEEIQPARGADKLSQI